MKDLLRPAILLTAVFTALCGLAYPAVVTVLAQTVLPHQAEGSLLTSAGKVVGSELVGQSFSDPGHFWGRPSAIGYDAKTSSGTNQGPTNPTLLEAVRARVAALRAADPGNDARIPVDLVTASSSGLDPHISPAAARYQVGRVARIRDIPASLVAALVDRHIEERTLGILGEPRVNVLKLNLALDASGPAAR